MPVRKLIVKAFVREVILDNGSVTITHNFNISTKNLKWHSRGCLTYTSAEQSSAVKHPPKQLTSTQIKGQLKAERIGAFAAKPLYESPRKTAVGIFLSFVPL